MFLAIDLGNTNLVLGIFKDNQLEYSWRVATRRDGTVDEYGLICRNLFESAKLIYSELEGIVICSVVPPLNEVIASMCLKYLKIEPFWVEPAKQNLMPIRYSPVADVGADRIVTALAAFHRFKNSTIVVDFGTATTFDTISKQATDGGLLPSTSASVTLCTSIVTNLFWKPCSLHLFSASKPMKFPLFG